MKKDLHILTTFDIEMVKIVEKFLVECGGPLCCIVNTIAGNGSATQKASVSAAMVLTKYFLAIPVSVSKVLFVLLDINCCSTHNIEAWVWFLSPQFHLLATSVRTSSGVQIQIILHVYPYVLYREILTFPKRIPITLCNQKYFGAIHESGHPRTQLALSLRQFKHWEWSNSKAVDGSRFVSYVYPSPTALTWKHILGCIPKQVPTSPSAGVHNASHWCQAVFGVAYFSLWP